MARAGTFEMRTGMDLSGFRSGMSTAQSELKQFAEQSGQEFQRRTADIMRLGTRMTAAVTVPLTAMGAAVLSMSGAFEQSMNKVGALTQATGREFNQLRDLAKELGATTVFSASEAADGMSFLAMAGLETNQIIGAMPATLRLASAAQMDLARAADIATNIMTGYRQEVSELDNTVDVLAKTAVSANTDLGQLGDAMKFVGPVASGLGFQFEETAASIGMLSDAGIQGGMAGTTLRNILTRLDDAGKKWGITVRDAAGNMLPFADIIEQIGERGISSSEILEVFGDRAGPGMLALVSQGSDALRNFTYELENAGGTAERIADRQLEGFRGQLTMLKSATEGLLIAIGDSGLLGVAERLIGRVTSLVSWFSQLPPPVLATGTAIAAAAAATGPLLLGLGTLRTLLPVISTGVSVLGGLLGAAGGPIGWITLAAVAAGGLVSVFRSMKESGDDTAVSLGKIKNESDGVTAAFGRLNRAASNQELLGTIKEMAVYLDEDAVGAFNSAGLAAIQTAESAEEAAQRIAQAFYVAASESIVARMAIIQAEMTGLEAARQMEMQQLARAGEYVAELIAERELLDRTIADLEAKGEAHSDAWFSAVARRGAVDMMLQDVGGITNLEYVEKYTEQILALGEAYETMGGQLGEIYAAADDLPGLFATPASGGDVPGEVDPGAPFRKGAADVDAFSAAIEDAVVWAGRLVEEVELGLKTPGEAFSLIAPRRDEVRGERRDIVAGGGYGSFAHEVAVALDEILSGALHEIARAPGGVDLLADVAADFVSPYEELIARVMEEALVQDRADARHARGVERFKARVAERLAKALAFDEYLADMLSDERVARMIEDEVLGPSAGMGGLAVSGRNRYLFQQAEERVAEAKAAPLIALMDPERIAQMIEDEVLGPSAGMVALSGSGRSRALFEAARRRVTTVPLGIEPEVSVGRSVPLGAPVMGSSVDLSRSIAAIDEDIRLAGEEFRFAVTQAERDAAQLRIEALQKQRDEMTGAARMSGQEFASYVQSAGESLLGLFESIQSGSASGIISGVGGFASSIMGAIGGTLGAAVPWVGVATSLLSGVAGMIESGQASRQAEAERERTRAAGAQARGVSSFSINVVINSALQVENLTDQASRSAIRSYEEGLAERMLGAIERSLIPRIQNLENAVGI